MTSLLQLHLPASVIEMLQVLPDTWLMFTVTLSPGVTVQLASPVQLVSWVSLAGSSSYHA